MNKETRAAVDRLLMEQGEYIPLELLLAEGRLDFSDYERWRAGDVPRLEEVLFGAPEQLDALLSEAESYASALRLQPERLSYQGWGAAAGAPLRYSDHRAREERFRTVYRRITQPPQLDLFIDAAASRLVNGIVQALTGRDFTEARRLLDRLFEADPGHPRFGALEQMIEAGKRLAEPVQDCAQELQYLQQTLLPMAECELGRDSSSLLVPHWRRLTAALVDLALDPSRPQLHASFAAAQAFDWETVLAAAESDPAWPDHPVLLSRYAHACGRLHREVAALQHWFQLCWRFPGHANVIATDAHASLRQAWRDFSAVEPPLADTEFPAWMLLQRRGLASQLPEPDNDNVASLSYALIYEIQLRNSPAGCAPDKAEIALRRRLQEDAPLLFRHFMRNRTH